ncbi:MAG TPA: hypothetical protein VHB21_21600 [Minicystis sp.]|nr:hypothetical protein [Minicystis sp.]
MGTWTMLWRRLRGLSWQAVELDEVDTHDPEIFKRTRVMPNVVKPSRAARRSAIAAPKGPPPDVNVAQKGERFMLGWCGSYFGIWDAWAPAEPVRRFAQDPDGWQRAWNEFSELEPATAVRARGSWPSSIEIAKQATAQA